MVKEEAEFWAAIGAVLIAGTTVIGFSGIDELDAEQAKYCQMVSSWKREAEMGIPPDQRSGWPDYKGTYQEACK